MTIGSGIAIAGVWLFPAVCALAPNVTGFGLLVSVLAAGLVTGAVLLRG